MSSWGQSRPPQPAVPRETFCGHGPHLSRGWCQRCYERAYTLGGRLEAARAGVRHATEIETHFQRCAELALSPVERAHAIDLAAEWGRIAADAATDALELERRIARGEVDEVAA